MSRFLVEKRRYSVGVLSAPLLSPCRAEPMCGGCPPGGFPLSDKSLFHLWVRYSIPSSNCSVKPGVRAAGSGVVPSVRR